MEENPRAQRPEKLSKSFFFKKKSTKENHIKGDKVSKVDAYKHLGIQMNKTELLPCTHRLLQTNCGTICD